MSHFQFQIAQSAPCVNIKVEQRALLRHCVSEFRQHHLVLHASSTKSRKVVRPLHLPPRKVVENPASLGNPPRPTS